GVPGVDEHAYPPALADPLGVLGAHHQQTPSGQDRVALLHAEAEVIIAAHRRVAAGAEEKAARDLVAAGGNHAPDLSSQQEVAIPPHREEQRTAGDPAEERTRGERVGGAAKLEHREIAAARRNEVVGPAEGAAIAEVERVTVGEFASAHAFLLPVRGDDHRARWDLGTPVAREAGHGLARAHVLDV